MERKKEELSKEVRERTEKLIEQLKKLETKALSAIDSVGTENAKKIKTT